MVKKINKKIKVIKEKEYLEISDNIKNKINKYWNDEIQKNPKLFNGEVWSVSEYNENEKEIILNIKKTNYSHYLYDERIGINNKEGCYNLSCGILLETSDSYYVIGLMDETTSFPNGLSISGGNLDESDIKTNGEVDIINTVSRELKEELNIDLFNKQIMKSFDFKYLEYPEDIKHSYSIIMKGKLQISSKELNNIFEEYKKYLIKTNGEIEFKKLYFLNCFNAKNELKSFENKKRSYLEELIELDYNKYY